MALFGKVFGKVFGALFGDPDAAAVIPPEVEDRRGLHATVIPAAETGVLEPIVHPGKLSLE